MGAAEKFERYEGLSVSSIFTVKVEIFVDVEPIVFLCVEAFVAGVHFALRTTAVLLNVNKPQRGCISRHFSYDALATKDYFLCVSFVSGIKTRDKIKLFIVLYQYMWFQKKFFLSFSGN